MATKTLFDTSMGNYNLKIYDVLGSWSIFGQLFHLSFVLLNLLMLVNLIIAIMADTYGNLVTK